jgi:hypothetical protein
MCNAEPCAQYEHERHADKRVGARAGTALSARHAAERVLACWHSAGSTEELRESMQVRDLQLCKACICTGSSWEQPYTQISMPLNNCRAHERYQRRSC